MTVPTRSRRAIRSSRSMIGPSEEVIEAQLSVQPLDSGHHGHLGRLEPEAALSVLSHLKEPESKEATHKIRMYAGETRITVRLSPERASEWVPLLR